MGAWAGGYRWRVVEIRDATWDDFDAVVELLDARSRAVFGISEVQADHVRQRWELPGFERGWVAAAKEGLTGCAHPAATQEATISAEDAGLGDALLERVLTSTHTLVL